MARERWGRGEGILEGRGLFDLCFLEDLCDLLGERDFFGVRLRRRERDRERDWTFRQRPGLRERERDRGMGRRWGTGLRADVDFRLSLRSLS